MKNQKRKSFKNKQRGGEEDAGGNPFIKAFNAARQNTLNEGINQIEKLKKISNKGMELKKTIDTEFDTPIDTKISNNTKKLEDFNKKRTSMIENKKKTIKKLDDELKLNKKQIDKCKSEKQQLLKLKQKKEKTVKGKKGIIKKKKKPTKKKKKPTKKKGKKGEKGKK